MHVLCVYIEYIDISKSFNENEIKHLPNLPVFAVYRVTNFSVRRRMNGLHLLSSQGKPSGGTGWDSSWWDLKTWLSGLVGVVFQNNKKGYVRRVFVDLGKLFRSQKVGMVQLLERFFVVECPVTGTKNTQKHQTILLFSLNFRSGTSPTRLRTSQGPFQMSRPLMWNNSSTSVLMKIPTGVLGTCLPRLLFFVGGRVWCEFGN